MMERLYELKAGKIGRVKSLLLDGTMRRRLMDIGFYQGSRIACLGKSPLGDPIAYEINGAVIALRKEDAKKIEIITEDQAWD